MLHRLDTECPHCKSRGAIECPEDFHPELVFCGACEDVYPYSPDIWQHLLDENDDLEGPMGLFYASAQQTRAAPLSPSEPRLSDHDWLARLPLKYVLAGYKGRRRPRQGSILLSRHGECRSIQEDVVKTFLDSQPHVPRKGEIPQSPAEHVEVPSTQQWNMGRNTLVQIAERLGFIEWRESQTIEQVRVEGGTIWAYSWRRGQRPRKSHRLPNRNVYFCREYLP
jgi:hypothetical protein